MSAISDPLVSFLVDLPAMSRWAEEATRQYARLADRSIASAIRLEGKSEELLRAGITLELVLSLLDRRVPLTRRQRRFAVQHWDRLGEEQLLPMVDADRDLIPILRRSILQRFRLFHQQSSFPVIERIRSYERQGGPRIGARSFDDWLTIGPTGLATLLTGHPDTWDGKLVQLGMGVAWDFSNLSRTHALRRWLASVPLAQALSGFAHAGGSRYLPARIDAKNARNNVVFWAQPEAHELVGLWLEAARLKPAEAAAVDEHLLATLLQDPLGPMAQKAGWLAVEKRAPDAYRALLQRISRSDIEFFFREAESRDARERGQFWLGYLGSVRRTKCFLCRGDRDAALVQAQRSDSAEHRLALNRASRVSSGAVNAFIMWFDTFVVVEFSRTGHATYVYRPEEFETLRRIWSKGEIGIPDDLKAAHLDGTLKLSHHAGWQWKFEAALRERGVVRDLRTSASLASGLPK